MASPCGINELQPQMFCTSPTLCSCSARLSPPPLLHTTPPKSLSGTAALSNSPDVKKMDVFLAQTFPFSSRFPFPPGDLRGLCSGGRRFTTVDS